MLALASVAPALQRDNPVARALTEYSRGDGEAIARLVSAVGGSRLLREVDAAIGDWSRDRPRIHAAFLLELAFANLEVFERARKFVTGRRERPGANLSEDEFEVAWHQTAIAFLQNQRRPDVLDRLAIAPLMSRLTPSQAPQESARLTAPWFALSVAIAEEQWMDAEPWNLEVRGPSRTARGRDAAQRFEEAAVFEVVRHEALVRLSQVYFQLGKPAESLAALDRLGEVTGDRTLRYWSLLFRGRALEALDRHDEAVRAYERARSVAPDAQAPATALAALERRRGRLTEAARWAAIAREARSPSTDPWRQYATGEFRFLRQRLDRVREMAR